MHLHKHTFGLAFAPALLFFAAAPSAAFARDVTGPAGLRVAQPAAMLACGAKVTVAVRFTQASARRGVRRVQVSAAGRSVTFTARRGVRRTAKLAVPCGKTVRVSYQPRSRRGRGLGQRIFTVKVAAAQAPGAAPGPVGMPGSGQVPVGADPHAGSPPPGAQTPDAVSSTRWSNLVDLRRSGPRSGQSCAQVTATTPAGDRHLGVPTFCGLLSEDAVVAKTARAVDPADGTQRLVLAGVASERVQTVTVAGPDGVRTLQLSEQRDGMPGTAGGFIVVYPASVTAADLTLIVTLAGGAQQTFPAPAQINMRSAAGERL